MPPLKNPRRERFAIELAKGKSAVDAYEAAGYRRDTGNAAVLRRHPEVRARAGELALAAATAAGIDINQIIDELAKIAFADIGKAVEWGTRRRDDDDDDEEDAGYVHVKDLAEIDPDTVAAIAGIAQTRTGVKVKFHDKRRALATLAKIFGLFDTPDESSGNVIVRYVDIHGRELNKPE
jgi:phage terminase small subunit